MIKWRREKMIGSSDGKHRYDLPLNKSSGTGFLTLLVALMTFLAVLALATSFVLSAMTERWSSGLENKITVEIPAETDDGKLLNRTDIRKKTVRVTSLLKKHPAIISAHALSDSEITDLIKPWLGDDVLLQNIPVPGLISLEISGDDDIKPDKLLSSIRTIAPNARIDTHESWLNDLLRFTGALQFAAFMLTLVIGAITATAVAGAIRSRLAVHKEEVELLHLMGASDNYIARQFQRHSMILALQGGGAGTLAGGLALLIVNWISGEMGVNLLPDFTMSPQQISLLLALPVVIALIAIITARRTVHSVLCQMP